MKWELKDSQLKGINLILNVLPTANQIGMVVQLKIIDAKPNDELYWSFGGEKQYDNYNSQSTFVFPLKCGNDTIPMFMGDRWSYPHQASAATYVWMPLQVDGTKISIPEYWQAWDIKKLKPADALNKGKKLYGSWKSNQKGDVLEIAFKGTHVAIVGETNPHGGYAKVSVLNAEKDTVYSSLVDFYSKYPEKAIRIITPKMPKANYTLQVEITGVRPVWTDKTKTIYGSDDTFVTIDNVYHF